MPIDNKVAVGSLLVLANPSLNQRRIFQGREAKGNILADILQRLRSDCPLTESRIEIRPARIVGDLETAPVAAGNAIPKLPAMIGPHWHLAVRETRISGRRAEEKYVLLGCLH